MRGIPGGRLPAKPALLLAIIWTVCGLASGVLACTAGDVKAFLAVVAVVELAAAGCYWFRYTQASRDRA
ncbi:hypothetical protein MUY14_26990 [Amycolatopsis sp. FBCC-B4732]|uniref:hypothetical protein n=1 Tax=Amycolatopsis sp. FBCC-B4732 TaxID=3079339 RepID=UPI001FF1EFE3|nr:hypothetical protein [Amycolatopsis sp. FBCC-B4732]UOX85428.1 hypothetical protein MUY14_26990 [Amycolatopsis sp. FBCC-B4732]